MESYVLTGNIYKASHEAMEALMQSVLGNTKSRSRLFGFDILFETEPLRFFCSTTANDGREWSVNAEYTGPSQAWPQFLSDLTQKLLEAGFNYALGYTQVDAEGNDLGEEIALYHPDFDRLYFSSSPGN